MFFAGVTKEFEIMLERSTEQVAEITMGRVELEFTPTSTIAQPSVFHLEFVWQQMHAALTALTIYEPTTSSPTRGRTRWIRHRSNDRSETTKHASHEQLSWKMPSLGTSSWSGGIGARGTLNSNCLRTFEDARQGIVTHAEAKFV